MNRPRVWALGQDLHWLETVKRAFDDPDRVEIVECPGNLADCLDRLSQSAEKALLLLDASGQRDIASVVRMLRNLGWHYVVVVAADPSVNEARAVLRRNLGYDYWRKTYSVPVVRADIERGFEELLQNGNVIKHSHVTASSGYEPG
jgi:hypothetical protein